MNGEEKPIPVSHEQAKEHGTEWPPASHRGVPETEGEPTTEAEGEPEPEEEKPPMRRI